MFLRKYFKDERLNKIWNICRGYDCEFFEAEIEKPFFGRKQHSFIELASEAEFTDNFKTDRHVSGNCKILFCKPSEVKMYILDSLHEIEAMLCISPLDGKGLYLHYKCGNSLTIAKYEIESKKGISKLIRSYSQGTPRRYVELAEFVTPENKDVESAFYYPMLENGIVSPLV